MRLKMHNYKIKSQNLYKKSKLWDKAINMTSKL